jgi:hypothetical protein
MKKFLLLLAMFAGSISTQAAVLGEAECRAINPRSVDYPSFRLGGIQAGGEMACQFSHSSQPVPAWDWETMQNIPAPVPPVDPVSVCASINSPSSNSAVSFGGNSTGAILAGTGSPRLDVIYNGVKVTGSGAAGGVKSGTTSNFSLFGPFTCSQIPDGVPVGNTGNPLGAATAASASGCNGAWGSVNGQDVCVPKSLSSQNTVGALKADSSTTTTSGGVTTGSTTIGSTTCDGAACTTTKTTTTIGGATSTTEEVKPQADFCSSNPASPLCNSSKSECEKNPDSVGCMKVGDMPTSDVMTKANHAVSVVAQTFAAGGSCPQSLAFTVSGHSYAVSYQPLCNQLQNFRAVIIALGGIAAAFILADSFRV